jgi:hypothetical protein
MSMKQVSHYYYTHFIYEENEAQHFPNTPQ